MFCAVTVMFSADLHSLNIYMVCGCMCISSICVCAWCSCQWKICSPTDLSLTHIWYIHTATYQVNNQRTQISGRHYSKGTKHVCAWCSCQWKICSQTDLSLTTAPSTHTNRLYIHTATYQVNNQRTQISRIHYSNGTKHNIWPPEDGRIKRTETCRGFLCLQTCF